LNSQAFYLRLSAKSAGKKCPAIRPEFSIPGTSVLLILADNLFITSIMTVFSSFTALIQVVTLGFYLHPLHISVTEIEYDEKDKALEIMMRVFIDDLELALRNNLKQPELDILDAKNGMTIDQMAGTYLKDRFKISLDNKAQEVKYLGHEREGDAFIFYVEVSKVKRWKTIQILNSIITETHDDQSNLVHVTVKDKVRSLRLTRDTPVDKLTFDPK
jgi:hypothetical protein